MFLLRCYRVPPRRFAAPAAAQLPVPAERRQPVPPGRRTTCWGLVKSWEIVKLWGKNMISYGIIWFYMVLYGFIWFYIVLYGFIWFYIWVPMAMRVPNSWMVVENPNLEWMITRGTPILGNPHVGNGDWTSRSCGIFNDLNPKNIRDFEEGQAEGELKVILLLWSVGLSLQKK